MPPLFGQPRSGDIGEPLRKVDFEPIPETAPIEEPSPEAQPQPTQPTQPVPAGV